MEEEKNEIKEIFQNPDKEKDTPAIDSDLESNSDDELSHH